MPSIPGVRGGSEYLQLPQVGTEGQQKPASDRNFGKMYSRMLLHTNLPNNATTLGQRGAKGRSKINFFNPLSIIQFSIEQSSEPFFCAF
jgi:hypothetical protein